VRNRRRRAATVSKDSRAALDAIVSIGEECDDGVNAGGYGKCGAGCKLSAFCGDGVVQAAEEDCDDGVNIGSPCPSGCHILIVE